MGQVIAGRYELDHEVGRGGMGAVWLAHDSVLGRAVALKRIGVLPGTQQSDLDRVEREARVSAMLHHEHVVSVFDLISEDDRHWLVMEYVPSRTLAQVVHADGALSPDRTAHLMGQVAAALAAAHAAGIVHRDVKPSNILVTEDDRVKLGDFGIARAAADTTLTQTGMVTGSPSYLAPEVAAGGPATAASDLWSLGATVFHAVTGSPPYDARDNVLGALYRIVNEEPPRTDHAGWLDPLLRSTMDHDPRRRWSAGQAAEFLARGPLDEPTLAVPAAAPPTPTTPLTVPGVAAAAAGGANAAGTIAAGTNAADSNAAEDDGHHRGRAAAGRPGNAPAKLVAALAGLILVLVLVAWLAGRGSEDPVAEPGPGQTTGETGAGDGNSGSGGNSGPGGGDGDDRGQEPPDADEMVEFAEDYLATVVGDPASAWPSLTPAFQQASGGFDDYEAFWSTIEDYDLRAISADPEAMTVSYTVEYSVSGEGRRPAEEVTLELVQRGDELLIDGER